MERHIKGEEMKDRHVLAHYYCSGQLVWELIITLQQ